jgi:hypothetical protein
MKTEKLPVVAYIPLLEGKLRTALVRVAGNLTQIGRFEQAPELQTCSNYALKAVSYRNKYKEKSC